MSFLARYCCFGATLVYIVTSILAYHFDVDNIILYADPARPRSRGSYFGYTVALWNPGNRNLNESWMFIGAPRANSSAYPGVKEPGTVFKCKIGEPCGEWVMDNKITTKPKNGSWLGGSIAIENKTNPEILVCGPKWVDETFGQNDSTIRQAMPGMCYWAMADNLSTSQNDTRNPLLQTSPFYGETKHDLQEVGFSVHMNPDHSPPEFVLSCPRPMRTHGIAIRSNRLGKNNGPSNIFTIPTPVESLKDDTDYSGYAVTSGKYFLDRERMYAIGAPRGGNLFGNVDLFDFVASKPGLTIRLSLIGEQIGEYFGAALASCDIDGNGKDDLMVGAPQWTKNFDELGRIYIFRGGVRNFYQFKITDHLKGKTHRGRFGSAITCLGDIDYDGYADVAVGAPYDGNGAVYIFHGSKNGLVHSQTIAGSEDTRGFGFSISEPRDVDNNGYADIAIGAYLSGHVTLIRSKRVVTMTYNISTHLSGKLLKRNVEVFPISVCSSYEGPYPPQELNVAQELKIDEMYKRAKIVINGKNLTTYELSEIVKLDALKSCQNFTIQIIKTASFDYLHPLTFSVSPRLNTIAENGALVVEQNNVTGTDNFHISDAIMKGSKAFLDIPFEVDCHRGICRSHLSIELVTDLEDGEHYVIGSVPHLKLNVTVKNSGDNAYLAKARVDIPIFIEILKMPSTCTRYSKNEAHNQILCEVGNPLAENETRIVSINLDMHTMPSHIERIEFKAIANTTSEDAAFGNCKTDLLINGVVEADIGIVGIANTKGFHNYESESEIRYALFAGDRKSFPRMRDNLLAKTVIEWYSYMRAQEEENMPNIMFQHTYEIRNHEVTPLSEALLSISFPTHWIHADNEIEIIKLNETFVNLDGQKFDCQNSDEKINIRSSSYDATVMPEWLLGENSSRLSPYSEKKFTIIDGKVFSASPDNRTLYINTTNPSVQWRTIDCLIGPFKTAQSTARIILTLELLLSNLSPEIMQDKDIIFFATNGSTKITVPPNFSQTKNNKPDMVMIGTTFIESMTQRQVATWVIALSILIGVLLLMLMVFALYKFGFFNRSKKAKLEAMMEQRGRIYLIPSEVPIGDS